MSLADRQETPNAQGAPLIWPPDMDDDGEGYIPSRQQRRYTDYDMDDGKDAPFGRSPGRRRKRRLSTGLRQSVDTIAEDDEDAEFGGRRGNAMCSRARIFFERIGLLVLAGLLWCGSVYIMLRWQRFPFHRHKVEVAMMCLGPLVLYWVVILIVDSLISCLERRRDKRKEG